MNAILYGLPMLRPILAALICFATPSLADGAYYLCDIFNGQVSGGCGSWYQGKAVVKKDDGRYYECDIFNGQSNSGCGSWYQGKAVVQKDDGSFYECDIFNGEPSGGCGSWYQGKAVVWKEEPAPVPAQKAAPAAAPKKQTTKKK